MTFTLPSTTARIEITNLEAGARTDRWDCTYKIIDTSNNVISSQSFTLNEYYVPSGETDKALYIAKHYQAQIYDGAVWIAAIVATEE